MASSMISGLLKANVHRDTLWVIEPLEATREQLRTTLGITAHAAPSAHLQNCELVVWAVKPQNLKAATRPIAPLSAQALHLSIAAGVTSNAIAAWLGTERVVRAMPNTPALIGQGMTGLFARPAVSPADRACIERIITVTGQYLWVSEEAQLDAVTALSGSGPAYVFYFLEGMVQAAQDMGLSPAQATALALSTFAGSTALAQASTESLATLRERVTSPGGTTYAALTQLAQDDVQAAFKKAIFCAQARAQALGAEFTP